MISLNMKDAIQCANCSHRNVCYIKNEIDTRVNIDINHPAIEVIIKCKHYTSYNSSLIK